MVIVIFNIFNIFKTSKKKLIDVATKTLWEWLWDILCFVKYANYQKSPKLTFSQKALWDGRESFKWCSVLSVSHWLLFSPSVLFRLEGHTRAAPTVVQAVLHDTFTRAHIFTKCASP